MSSRMKIGFSIQSELSAFITDGSQPAFELQAWKLFQCKPVLSARLLTLVMDNIKTLHLPP